MTRPKLVNGQVADRSCELRVIVDDMISDDFVVELDDYQYMMLTRALDKIEALGDIGFVLEACIDRRPGHLVRWHSTEKEVAVDAIMRQLINDLGFVEDEMETVI